jgi:hypothetical protein
MNERCQIIYASHIGWIITFRDLNVEGFIKHYDDFGVTNINDEIDERKK